MSLLWSRGIRTSASHLQPSRAIDRRQVLSSLRTKNLARAAEPLLRQAHTWQQPTGPGSGTKRLHPFIWLTIVGGAAAAGVYFGGEQKRLEGYRDAVTTMTSFTSKINTDRQGLLIRHVAAAGANVTMVERPQGKEFTAIYIQYEDGSIRALPLQNVERLHIEGVKDTNAMGPEVLLDYREGSKDTDGKHPHETSDINACGRHLAIAFDDNSTINGHVGLADTLIITLFAKDNMSSDVPWVDRHAIHNQAVESDH
ncbi:MAG: hypothetical protein MMC23_003115 [Stictis urceolatum]|nr:hypothetical protein [Stictis urceolata]